MSLSDDETGQRTFESWLESVIAESSLQLRLIAIDHALKKEGLWGAALSGQDGETHVIVNADVHQTEASVKEQIRRQLEDYRRRAGL
jgi:hypothetical protein